MKKNDFNFSAYVEEKEAYSEKQKKYLRRKKAVGVIKKITSVAREALDIYSSIKRKDYISIGLGTLSATGSILEHFSTNQVSDDVYLVTKEMGLEKGPQNSKMLIYSFLKDMNVPYKVIWKEITKDDGGEPCSIEEWDLGDSSVYFLKFTSYLDGPFLKDRKQFNVDMGKVIRANLGRHICIESGINIADYANKVSFSKISLSFLGDPYVSHLDQKQLIDDIKLFFDKSYNRSLLFYGPPGSGKTTLALRISNTLNESILSIKGGILISRSAGELIEIIDMIDPTIILFDDMDKIPRLEQILGTIEEFNNYRGDRSRLFIATINDLSKVPMAMRRPGRFDQIISFGCPEIETRLKMVEEYAKSKNLILSAEQILETATLLEGMTGAFIKDIITRISVLGYEKVVPNHINEIKNIVFEEEDLYEEEEDLIVTDSPKSSLY